MPEPTRPGDLARPRALLASIRLLLRRRRVTRWAAAAGLGLTAAWWTTAAVADAERERDAWASTEEVWVATRDVAAGRSLDRSDVRVVTLPAAAVPASAARASVVDPVGRRVRVDLHHGEVVLDPRLAPAGASAVAARLPPGTLGLVLPVDDGRILEVGDTVDLFDLLAGRRLAEGAPVVGVDDRGITVAVAADRVSAVIAARADGGVVPALHP